jgi:hypothetical protein
LWIWRGLKQFKPLDVPRGNVGLLQKPDDFIFLLDYVTLLHGHPLAVFTNMSPVTIPMEGFIGS